MWKNVSNRKGQKASPVPLVPVDEALRNAVDQLRAKSAKLAKRGAAAGDVFLIELAGDLAMMAGEVESASRRLPGGWRRAEGRRRK